MSIFLNKRAKAFRFAFEGISASLKHEPHMRIHFVAAICVIFAALFFNIQAWQWIAVLLCIALVMMAEIFNTAIERICDLVHPDVHPSIKYIKDISSAAVLVICLASLITGVIIFFPHLKMVLGF